MNKIFVFALTALMLSSTAFAAQDKPVDITADSLEIRQIDGVAVFTGIVHASHDGLELSANRVEVKYNPDNKSAGQSVDTIEAIEKVTITYGQDTATGEKAVYDLKTKKINLSGNVVLLRGENILKGEKLMYDVQTGHMKLDSAANKGRVKASFTPGKVK